MCGACKGEADSKNWFLRTGPGHEARPNASYPGKVPVIVESARLSFEWELREHLAGASDRERVEETAAEKPGITDAGDVVSPIRIVCCGTCGRYRVDRWYGASACVTCGTVGRES